MAKQATIKIGDQYQARVSGRHVIVRIDSIHKPDNWRTGRKEKTKFGFTNLNTGRPIWQKTAAFFRKKVKDADLGWICRRCDNPTNTAIRTCLTCYKAAIAKERERKENTV